MLSLDQIEPITASNAAFDSMPYEDANNRSQRYWDIGFLERQEGVEAPKATIYGGKPAFSRPPEESFGGLYTEDQLNDDFTALFGGTRLLQTKPTV